MKKFLLGILIFAGLSAVGFATYTNTSSTYKAPILKTALNFQATYADGKVSTSRASIDNITNNGMKRYKVVKSKSNHFPVYPEDGYIKAISDRGQTSFIETNPSNGTRYYRVCAIMQDMNRYCSNVVTLTIDETSSTYTTTTTKPSIAVALTSNLKTMIEGLAAAFMDKLEDKYPGNLDAQIAVLDALVAKIPTLAKGKYASLFIYLGEKLEEYSNILRLEQLLDI